MTGSSARALTASPAALAWLAHTHSARCLHLFDRACSLINEEGEVLSVVAPEIGDGPFNIVIADPYPSFAQAGAEMPSITISRQRLVLNETSIDLGNVAVWRPKPDWPRLHAQRARLVRQLFGVHEWIREHAKPDSLMQFHPFDDVDRSSKDPLEPWIGALCAAVANADVEACRAAARRVAGLGPGLTPAGDDLILGAIYAAWVVHPPERASLVTHALAGAAQPRTTSLSAAWLRAGSRGEAGILWHYFLHALLLSDPLAIRRSVDRLLAVGHTSGADALAGFVGSLFHFAAACPEAVRA